ncbi:DNA polymerase III subunit delta' [Buchnera aphidicola (Melanaphis sacchari)]|uniref:DNA polymerase III subunit delta' n=1 Tax=Buchnera aphidicola (Melanaphis sacchari) TaxID=2173854 RepID=A0A2U8DF39_9GAMM|nr:DNA polymerase III subunit delta' C-terminal domain-containing protein [Buchnera aphidicola]AWH90440.1 DNA polymerase III subunit delta' [Buchnera aphidicola (Melanaphis sacchari)]
MKIYPWLKKKYEEIIQKHQEKKAHHAILIKTYKGIGVFRLIWAVSKWLLCLKPKGIYPCEGCHGCTLMSSKNHPDWHEFTIEKNNFVSVDDIRKINQKIFQSAQQGQSKIIFFSNTKKLTEQAMNALLKTLEEPPKKTWFFFIDYNYLKSHSTLRSRCIIYRLLPPKEKNSIKWLSNKNTKKNTSNITALRINQSCPLSSEKFINGDLWNERKILCKNLFESIKNKNLLKILPILCQKNMISKIDWICFILFDAIKTNFKDKKKIINLDQLELVNFLSTHYNNIILNKSIDIWIQCKNQALKIPTIDKELLLLEKLLIWEKTLYFAN